MRYFDNNGCLKIGKFRGTYFNKLTSNYIEWASKTIDGFRKELSDLHGGEIPKPGKREARTLDLRSSSGHGGIKNEGLAAPGKKKFVSRATRPTPPVASTQVPSISPYPDEEPFSNSDDDSPPWKP